MLMSAVPADAPTTQIFPVTWKSSAKADAIGGFMFRLREMDQPMDHFDERLWLDVIDRVVAHRDGLTFKFQNGKEIRV